jgi:hypothetical protein
MSDIVIIPDDAPIDGLSDLDAWCISYMEEFSLQAQVFCLGESYFHFMEDGDDDYTRWEMEDE